MSLLVLYVYYPARRCAYACEAVVAAATGGSTGIYNNINYFWRG